MRAFELISEEIPPLKHTDTGDVALQWMEEFKVSHLPVLKNENFVGLVSESDLYDKGYTEKTLHELFMHLPRPYVNGNAHLYEVLTRIAQEHITVVPVIDEEENFLGCIAQEKLLQHVADTGSIKEAGGILVLEINTIDYSLAEIAQIVEGENAKILSSFISSVPDSTKLDVTLKINQVDLSRVIRSFERYDYQVKASFQKSTYHDDLKNRYDELMKFLNM